MLTANLSCKGTNGRLIFVRRNEKIFVAFGKLKFFFFDKHWKKKIFKVHNFVSSHHICQILVLLVFDIVSKILALALLINLTYLVGTLSHLYAWHWRFVQFISTEICSFTNKFSENKINDVKRSHNMRIFLVVGLAIAKARFNDVKKWVSV